MEQVKILWSGITGRTGKEALKALKECPFASIVAGVCRTDNNYYHYDELEKIKEKYDVIVDFSHKDSFDKVLDLALKHNKPLIVGTAGLEDYQKENIKQASNIIPIFVGGNFRFDVKSFIDDVVKYAKNSHKSRLTIVETHYKTKKVPSETAKVIAKRVKDEAGIDMDIESHLEYDDLINDWTVDNLNCHVVGFYELGRDVLKIASLMKNKKPNGIYDLDRLFKEDHLDK